jgi:pimeloyl-ACP methyl ester carboxylesterase
VRLVRRILLGILLALGLLAAAAAAYDAFVPFESKPPQELSDGPFVRLDGRLVAYRRWGASGSPIVLIPGFAEPSFVFERVGPLLARHHRVYALDLAGYGYSERQGPYGLDGWSAEVRAFLRHFRIERPLLVGHSLGAAVAVAVAQQVPVRGVVLADGDALAEGGPPGWLTDVLVPPFRTAAFRLVLDSDWAVRRILARAYGPLHPDVSDAEVERWRRPFHVEGSEQALFDSAKGGPHGYTLDELRRLRLRALVLWGSKDDVDSLSAGRKAAKALRAPIVVLPGAGHLGMLVLPARWAEAVNAFAR